MEEIKRIMWNEPLPCRRKVSLIVVHCTATRENRRYCIRALDRDHRSRGFEGIGYHFYVTRDGVIYQTRDMECVGAHTAGYNTESVGVCYEGGLTREGSPADTRTPEQKRVLGLLLEHLWTVLGRVRIVGHRDLNPKKECPCFDVATDINISRR